MQVLDELQEQDPDFHPECLFHLNTDRYTASTVAEEPITENNQHSVMISFRHLLQEKIHQMQIETKNTQPLQSTPQTFEGPKRARFSFANITHITANSKMRKTTTDKGSDIEMKTTAEIHHETNRPNSS